MFNLSMLFARVELLKSMRRRPGRCELCDNTSQEDPRNDFIEQHGLCVVPGHMEPDRITCGNKDV